MRRRSARPVVTFRPSFEPEADKRPLLRAAEIAISGGYFIIDWVKAPSGALFCKPSSSITIQAHATAYCAPRRGGEHALCVDSRQALVVI